MGRGCSPRKSASYVGKYLVPSKGKGLHLLNCSQKGKIECVVHTEALLKQSLNAVDQVHLENRAAFEMKSPTLLLQSFFFANKCVKRVRGCSSGGDFTQGDSAEWEQAIPPLGCSIPRGSSFQL